MADAISNRPAGLLSTRVSFLDGFRGIAILLVLFEHLQTGYTGGYLSPLTHTGTHGVTIFFVLSGYLITSKLTEGEIQLKQFYIRRFFRLMPAAWTYIALVLSVQLLLQVRLTSFCEISSCLFFYRNMIIPVSCGLLTHFWSLSLEEQFYLIWPTLLLFFGVRRCLWGAGLAAMACAAFRFYHWNQYYKLWVSFRSEVRADAILIGCCLALVILDSSIRNWIFRYSSYLMTASLAVLCYCIMRFWWLPTLVENISIAVLLATCILNPGSLLARALSFRPLVWLGTISYSVYVWQEIFLVRPVVIAQPYAPVMILFIAPLSYILLEQPLTRLGRQISSHA